MDMRKFESSQNDESRAQSTDSFTAYRNTSVFKCMQSNVHNVYVSPVQRNKILTNLTVMQPIPFIIFY